MPAKKCACASPQARVTSLRRGCSSPSPTMATTRSPRISTCWLSRKCWTPPPPSKWWMGARSRFQFSARREIRAAADRSSARSPREKATATAHGTVIPLLLDNESWSYHYTPDVRYGKEDLYQAFQLHTHHLHRWELRVQ